MRAETLAGALGVTGLLLSAVMVLRAPSASLLPRAQPRVDFPPQPAARFAVATAPGWPSDLAPDVQVARLGRAPPRLDPLRRAFLEAPNLTQFALDNLPGAVAGDGASQYFIYLALDQCRSYLRRDLESARLNLERMLDVPELGGEERAAWWTEYERCRGFGLGGWDAIGQALGLEDAGSEAEYASLWFERATQSGYPTALTELALRPNPHTVAEREAMLFEALPQAGPDVYWLMFAHSADILSGETSVPALAWLIVACRAGQDCSEDARWYRSIACLREAGACAHGITALEHYWLAASPTERHAAWAQAHAIEAALATGRWEDLPFPDMERLNNPRPWHGE